MNWELPRNLCFGLGLLALVVGLLLRFRWGQVLLAAILVLLTLGALFSGDWHALDGSSPDGNPRTASRYCLWGGALGIVAALTINFFLTP